MAPSNKAKAAGVSASSFLDLKAELAKHEDDFSKKKTAGQEKYVVGGVKRPDKKPTVWARKNKGVASRSARDIELEAVSRPTLEAARAALERKAKIYDKLQRGQTGGLSEAQYDALLVDFDTKALEDHYESDSDDVDESLTVPKPGENDDDDPIVEYEDEFGRMRTARRSEVPRNLPQPAVEEAPEDDPYVIYNPVNHFPVFEPSAERVASIAAAASEEANPLETHYDATKEVRAKGAAFYNFSGDEETRNRQMDELRAARGETERTRQDLGAVDVKPGEVEGMTMRVGEGDGPKEGGTVKSRAMEKRKRELEERRKLVDAKRRKVKGAAEAPPSDAAALSPSIKETVQQVSPDDPFSALEKQGTFGGGKAQKTGPVANSTGSARHAADDFLSQLEKDIMSNQGK